MKIETWSSECVTDVALLHTEAGGDCVQFNWQSTNPRLYIVLGLNQLASSPGDDVIYLFISPAYTITSCVVLTQISRDNMISYELLSVALPMNRTLSTLLPSGTVCTRKYTPRSTTAHLIHNRCRTSHYIAPQPWNKISQLWLRNWWSLPRQLNPATPERDLRLVFWPSQSKVKHSGGVNPFRSNRL